jgi:hypothetical protein
LGPVEGKIALPSCERHPLIMAGKSLL